MGKAERSHLDPIPEVPSLDGGRIGELRIPPPLASLPRLNPRIPRAPTRDEESYAKEWGRGTDLLPLIRQIQKGLTEMAERQAAMEQTLSALYLKVEEVRAFTVEDLRGAPVEVLPRSRIQPRRRIRRRRLLRPGTRFLDWLQRGWNSFFAPQKLRDPNRDRPRRVDLRVSPAQKIRAGRAS